MKTWASIAVTTSLLTALVVSGCSITPPQHKPDAGATGSGGAQSGSGGGGGGHEGGGMAQGGGGSAPCKDAECIDPDEANECIEGGCVDGACGSIKVADGTLLSEVAQLAGDCHVLQCDGA